MSKKFVLNADDFGMSTAYNHAIAEGYEYGLLKSASLVANGDAFDEAVQSVIPKCEKLGVGIHLNIIEGKSLCKDASVLTDSECIFNKSYPKMLFETLKSDNKDFLEQVEREFRLQIEKILATKIRVTHIDSHVHTHSIPLIFDIVCRLAKEYGIKQVRTQFEKPYFIPNTGKHFQLKYPINLIKLMLLNYLTSINLKTLNKYELVTNDYLIGVTYTSMMDSLSISCGLEAVKEDNTLTEALIHPCRYEDGTVDNHFAEFLITKNIKLKEKIEKMGYEIVNYAQSF